MLKNPVFQDVPTLESRINIRLIFIEIKVNVDANHQRYKLHVFKKYDLRHS